MLLGVLALAMCFCGYLGIGVWIGQFSGAYRIIIFGSAITYFIPVTAHHVFCGVVEWFCIKLGRTEEARRLVVEFFKKTSVTMYAVMSLLKAPGSGNLAGAAMFLGLMLLI